MHFHIMMTQRCNSRCKYCYEKSMQEFDDALSGKFDLDLDMPVDTEINFLKLKKLIEKDENPWVIFYGGEPLVMVDKMKKIMDNIDAAFAMQTNGKLLDKIDTEYMNKFSKILVSFDGDAKVTDFNRGIGTYETVLKNIKRIRKNGFDGEIVARMTLGNPDINTQVLHILGLIDKGYFDSVHWQIDAGFYKFDFDKEKFANFVEEYNLSLTKLIDFWVEEMKKGKVWKIYPFIGIVDSLLKGEKTRLRCGSGYAGYTVTTNGKLVVCPIMSCFTDFYIGDLDSDPKNLKEIDVDEPCNSCSYLDVCGGRCLYANKTKLWPKEGQEMICDTVKYLIDSLTNKLVLIKELISLGKITQNDFEYEKYFGPEIIP